MAISRRGFLQATGTGLAATLLPTLSVPAGASPDAAGPILLNFNECPLGPCAAAQRAAAEVIPRSGRYLFALRRELVSLFAERHGLPAERLSAFAGSSDPLNRAGLAFTSPDAPLVLPDPTFDNLARTAGARGATVHAVPLDGDGAHDVEAMAAADPRAGLIYACNPNNPTATITPRARLEWLLERKPAAAVLLVDEAYMEYSDEFSLLDLVPQCDDLLVLRTFSKLYGMAGLRLGIAAGAPGLLRRLLELGDNPLPVTALVAGMASLRDPDVVGDRRTENARIRDATMDWLRARGHPVLPSAANFFMVDVGRDGGRFAEAMAQAGVVIGRSWPQWPQRVRVTVGSEDEMHRFREVFAETIATTAD